MCLLLDIIMAWITKPNQIYHIIPKHTHQAEILNEDKELSNKQISLSFTLITD